MSKNSSEMKRPSSGFTLVELSIVLVIIGLLVGGLLVAQSMIGTSKVTAFVAQVQQFDAGVAGFKATYNALPGDSKIFGGDEDGLIDQSDGADGHENQINTFACDIANFWFSLDQVKFPGSSGCGAYGVAPLISGASKNSPESKLGVVKSFILASAIGAGSYYADTTNPRNYYAVIGPAIPAVCCPSYNAFYTTDTNNAAVVAADMLALDSKMDDGNGLTGNVLSGVINNIGGTGYGGIYLPASVAQCSDNTGKYLTQNKTNSCTPLVRIGSQTNNLQ